MSSGRSGSCLQDLVLTPDRIPTFLIPSRRPLLFTSSQPHRSSSDRTQLLSSHDDDSPSPPRMPPRATVSPRFLLRLPTPRHRHPRRPTAALRDADTDVTTQAAMSLPHVAKVTTPYGFRAVLAASPCTRRRESLFHRNKPVTVMVIDADPVDPHPPGLSPGPGPNRSPVCLQPVKALGLQLMKALSPAVQRTAPR